jgi:hypothetical protein
LGVVVAHHGRGDSDVNSVRAFDRRSAVARAVGCTEAVFLPLEQRLVDFLVTDAREERGLTGRDVGDDIGNIFLDANLLVGLKCSDSSLLLGCHIRNDALQL